MSLTTINMFAPRIWGFDLGSAQSRVALEAGWRRFDLIWEGLMEQGCAAWKDGDRAQARRLFRRAGWVTWGFPASDLRRATTRAALGTTETAEAKMAQRMCQARAAFEVHLGAEIERMRIAPRARSSLFHLRMEARHRDTYHGNLRLRLSKIAEETVASLGAMEKGRAPEHRLYSRWMGERPTVYDDTRKVLAACLLIPGS